MFELTLLIPALEIDSATINLGGGQFRLKTVPFDDSGLVPYCCVSFAWGMARVPNPFEPFSQISARSYAVLNTALMALKDLSDGTEGHAIWLDTFCIPNQDQLKELYLSNMGSIYAKAAEVLVVLSSTTKPLLDSIRQNAIITDDLLLLLNLDQWVARAWTYQEIVNSTRLFFVAEGDNSKPVEGFVLFDAVANAIEPFCKREGFDMFTQLSKYGALTAFEAVVLDWRIGNYLERSAYQVMTNMCYRYSDQPNGHIDAMIGCIESGGNAVYTSDAPSTERFMSACEAKGDFSYIYSIGERSKEPYRKWRPVGGDFRPVFPWLYCYGKGQAGRITSEGLELSRVRLFTAHSIDPLVLGRVLKIMGGRSEATVDDPIAFVRHCLSKSGFTGCGQAIEVNDGYFFPQLPTDDTDIVILVATEISWTFGAPGLLVSKVGKDLYEYIGVGVFVGLPSAGEASVLIV